MTQSELEKRLHALRTDDGAWESWPELARRGQRQHSAKTRRRLLVGAVAFAILAVPALAVAIARGDFLSVSSTEADVPAIQNEEPRVGYVFGNDLRLPGRAPAKLAASILAPFLGQYTALAIPSADGRTIVYHAWERAAGEPEGGTPLLRAYEVETGRDTIVDRGAQAAAWRSDGSLAYSKALVPEYRNSPQGTTGGRIGHIVVRRSLDAPPERWSRLPTEWTPFAWAGRHLLAYAHLSSVVHGPQPEKGGVYAFTGPGRSRKLPINSLAAVSPDGRLAIGPAGSLDEFNEPWLLRVVDLETARVVARLDLRTVHRPRIQRGLQSGIGVGSWLGEWIALRTGIGETSGVLILRFADEKLTVDQVLRLTPQVAETVGLERGVLAIFGQPVFVDRAAREFSTQLTLLERDERGVVVYLTCDRLSLRCRRGRTLRPLTKWATLVYNPSRPLPSSGG